MESEDQGQGAEGLLSPRQVRDVLPRLFGRPHTAKKTLICGSCIIIKRHGNIENIMKCAIDEKWSSS